MSVETQHLSFEHKRERSLSQTVSVAEPSSRDCDVTTAAGESFESRFWRVAAGRKGFNNTGFARKDNTARYVVTKETLFGIMITTGQPDTACPGARRWHQPQSGLGIGEIRITAFREAAAIRSIQSMCEDIENMIMLMRGNLSRMWC